MKEINDEQIVQEAKAAGKRTGFCDLVNQQKDVNSAYGIGFIEGMVKYRQIIKEQNQNETEQALKSLWHDVTAERPKRDSKIMVLSRDGQYSALVYFMPIMQKEFSKWDKWAYIDDFIVK